MTRALLFIAALAAAAPALADDDQPPQTPPAANAIGGAGHSLQGKGIGIGDRDHASGGAPNAAAAGTGAGSGGGAGENADKTGDDDSCRGLPPQGATSRLAEAERVRPRILVGQDDAIDLRTVRFVKGVSIADWTITSRIKDVKVGRGSLCIEHTMAHKSADSTAGSDNEWPTYQFFDDKDTQVEGNQWVFALINGRWYGGAGEWIRPGQVCKSVSAANVGCGVFYDSEPLKSWRPKHGEMVGIAVSQPARAGQWGQAERSNVVIVPWP